MTPARPGGQSPTKPDLQKSPTLESKMQKLARLQHEDFASQPTFCRFSAQVCACHSNVFGHPGAIMGRDLQPPRVQQCPTRWC